MKTLEFATLQIEDFKEVREAMKLDFARLGLGAHFVRGENLVEPRLGSNGAGKTTLWHALMWCLFGETTNGLRGTDVRTWDTKNHPRVTASVYVNEKLFRITRSTVSNGLWIDDKVVQQSAIDDLIGLSVDNFPHTIMLGQGAPLFFDMKPREKLALLSTTLDLDRWDARSKEAKKRADDIATQQSALIHTTSSLINQLKDAQEQREFVTNKSDAWEQERTSAATKRDKSIADATAALNSATADMGDGDLAYDRAETELRASQKAQDKQAVIVDEASSIMAATRATNNEAIRALDDLIGEANGVLEGDDCPTCGQSLKGLGFKDHKARLNAKIKEQSNRVAKTAKASADAKKTLADAKERQSALFVDVAQWREASDLSIDKRTRAQTRVSEHKATLAALKANKGTADEKENPYSELCKQLQLNVKKLSRAIDEGDAAIAVLERSHGQAKYWIKGFKELRLHLLREALDELQAATQNILPDIGLDGWIVEFDIERETRAGDVSSGLNVTILKPGQQKPVRWEAYSGGEAQRLRLIGAVALSETLLRRAGVECDLMIMDEPTQHMSAEGVAETVEFILERGRNMQIFFVDHTAIDSSRFASTLIVRRDVNGARLIRQ